MRRTLEEKVRKFLIDCAQKRRTTTYSELMGRFDLTTREIRPILQTIVDEDENHELVSIVRSKITGKPSIGYFETLKRKKDKKYKKATKRCFKNWG